MARADSHPWQFKARFRRHAFGWKSQPAVQRVREATTEIRKAARRDPVLGAEGAVTLLERLSPALEHVDSSSGAIGTAVNHAIAEIVPIIADAPAEAATREAWLDRLWAALEADQVPYIESLGDRWGELCASKPVASVWADRLIDATRRPRPREPDALRPEDPHPRRTGPRRGAAGVRLRRGPAGPPLARAGLRLRGHRRRRLAAYSSTMKAAEAGGKADEVRARIRQIV